MGKKKFKDDIVYSTEKNVVQIEDSNPNIETLLPTEQTLSIRIEKKGRKGKSVTIINGYIGNKDDLAHLARQLKIYCGVGGTVKNGNIEIQGDFRTKIREKLIALGYNIKG